MRYHYERPALYLGAYGETYLCDHPVYSRCTLFVMNGKGLCVAQQKFDEQTKSTSWTEIEPWLTDSIYFHHKFKEFFDKRAEACTDGLYPTVTIRQLMWALKMKPIPRHRWETYFDRKNI